MRFATFEEIKCGYDGDWERACQILDTIKYKTFVNKAWEHFQYIVYSLRI